MSEDTQDEMARRVHETAHAPTADIPLTPTRPVSRVGAHPALERPCDAPDCQEMTAAFCATRDARIIHYCEAHERWAMEQAQIEGWWRV